MRCEWKECTIGDLCDTISETYKKGHNKVVLINTSDVLEGKVLNHISVENKKLKGQFKKTFKKDDILYSEIRPANRRYAFIDFDNTDNYIASTKLMVLRPRKSVVLPKFLYSILTAQNIIDELQHLAETRSGTFPQITFLSELSTMPIMLPPLETQKQIASILSALDNKIELNNKINENLEKQAQAIFKSWFVDFEPFGGVMPEDWNFGILSDIADVLSGKRPPMKQTEKTEDVCIPLVGAASVMGYTNEFNHNEKILVVGRVGTHGIVQRFCSPCWTSDNTLVIKSRYYEYVTQILQRIDYKAMNRGSTQPLITQGDLKKESVLIPNKNSLLKYESIVGTLMHEVAQNQKENERLAVLRDTLLPKLMNGEIDVSEVKI